MARHGNNIAPDYIEWNSNRAKNVVLPAEVKDPSRARVEITRQEHGVPRESSPRKAAIPRDEVPIAKIGRDGASDSLTT